jgi:hypothetical protein
VSISAMKQALDTLERLDTWLGLRYGNERTPSEKEVIRTLRQAIAEAEKQEPYGYFRYDIQLDAWVQNKESTQGVAFYTAPVAQCSYPKCQATNGCVGVCSKGQPDLARVGEVGVWGHKCEWVGLSDDEIKDIRGDFTYNDEDFNEFGFAKDIEAKLKERNT